MACLSSLNAEVIEPKTTISKNKRNQNSTLENKSDCCIPLLKLQLVRVEFKCQLNEMSCFQGDKYIVHTILDLYVCVCDSRNCPVAFVVSRAVTIICADGSVQFRLPKYFESTLFWFSVFFLLLLFVLSDIFSLNFGYSCLLFSSASFSPWLLCG